MKTILTTLILTLFIILTSFSQTFTDNGINYNVISTNPNEVEVTGGSVTNPLTIASSVSDGTTIYTVTTIGNSAFRNKSVTNVVLPTSITNINFRAFRDNGNLTSITLPANVTNVGGEAFFNGGLNEVIALGTIPPVISNSSFGTRSNIDVTVPNGFENDYGNGGWTGFASINNNPSVGFQFDDNGFTYTVLSANPNRVSLSDGNTTTGAITIPGTVTANTFSFSIADIGNGAFNGNGVTSVVMPNSVERIGVSAFLNNNLASIIVPVNVTIIEGNAFGNNPNLTTVTSNNPTAPTLGTNVFLDTPNNKALTIPNGSEASYEAANWITNGFATVNGNLAVGLEFDDNGITYTVTSANPNTISLKDGNTTSGAITIPATVTFNTTDLSVTAIEVNAFNGNNVTSVDIPVGVETIEANAFRNNPNLVTVASNNPSAPTLGTNVFNSTPNNKALIIPNGSLPSYEAANWTTNGFATINGNPVIGLEFDDNGITYTVTSTNPNTVTLKDGNATSGAITIPTTVTFNTTDLSVTAIGVNAFNDNNVTSVVIPASVETIEANAFRNNSNLNSVTSNNPTAPTLGSNVFSTTSSDKALTIPNGSEASYEAAGWNSNFAIINGNLSVGFQFNDGGFSYTVTSANPNTVTLSNGNNASGDIIIPETVTLNTLSLNVTIIGGNAFRNNAITSVVIPVGVTALQDGAFRGTSALSAVTSNNPIAPTLGFLTFSETPNDMALTIPNGSEPSYEAADWFNSFNTVNGRLIVGSTFESGDLRYKITSENPNTLEVVGRATTQQNIVIPDTVFITSNNETFTVTAVGSAALRDLEITSLILPSNIETIKINAFRDNDIDTINFPASLTTLEGFAFRGNELTSVNIPTGISTIAANTFSDNLLTSVTIPSNITSIENDAFNGNPLADVIADSAIPATITTSSFGTRSNINLTIIPDQQNVIDDYIAASWTGFASINGEFQVGAQLTVGDFQYEVTNVNPNGVKVLNRVTTGQNITIPATVSASGTTFNVTVIENNAFQNTDITSVILPASITTIGASAFEGSPLENVNAEGTIPPTIEENSFGDRDNISLTIPEANITDYENAGWTGFFSVNGNGIAVGDTFLEAGIQYEILTLAPNTVKAIGTNGTVPNGDFIFPEVLSKSGLDFTITVIGNSAFRNRDVNSVSFPSTLTTIEFRAFRNNGDLTSITLPASVTSVAGEAFFGGGTNEVIAEGTTPAVISNSSFGTRANVDVFIPQETTQAYIDAGWTGFKSLIEIGTLAIEIKVFLQGAYLNPNTGEEDLMRDDLRVAGLIPTTSPYSDGITCENTVFDVIGNNAIVDWIFLELRDATDNTLVLESKSALLQRDGDIVDVNGTSLVQFTSPKGNYFVVIKHRNHLGIMTVNILTLTENRNTIDFTDSNNPITFGNNAQSIFGMPTETLGLWAGNVNSDDTLRFQGSGNDTNGIKDNVLADSGNTSGSNLHVFSGYNNGDVDLNGTIRFQGSGNDSNTIKDAVLSNPENTTATNLFIIQEQLPIPNTN